MAFLRAGFGGLTWVGLAVFFYSAMSCFAKLASAHLNVWQIGVGRFGLGLVLVPGIVQALGLSLWGRQRHLLTLRGLFGAGAFLLLVAAFQRIPLSLAMVLFYLYPAFTALLSPWVAGEPTPRGDLPFIGGAFFGTTLILWPAESTGGLDLGHLFALIASVMAALTLLLVRLLVRENNIYTLFFYLCLVGTLASLGPLVLQDGPILTGLTAGWIWLSGVAIFSVGAQLSINKALTSIPAQKVSVMMAVEIPATACFGVIYLGEPLGWRLIIGALIILGCGLYLNLRPARAVSSHTHGRKGIRTERA